MFRFFVVVLSLLFLCTFWAGCSSEPADTPDSGSVEDASSGDADETDPDTADFDVGDSDADDPDADFDADSDADEPDTGAPDADHPGPTGGAAYRGAILFEESFEDDEFADRGWYDVSGGVELDTSNPSPFSGSTSAFVCHFPQGATQCAGGIPKRREFDETDAIYLSYWVRYSDGWIGSDRAYHPHEFHFVTNADDRWVGPARTHLTAYIEQVGGVPMLALQDSRNVDTSCILQNNDSFIGCDGSFDDYEFTEERSVCACNGLQGEVDGRDCFPTGNGNYYSSRSWKADEKAFDDDQWRFVESYLRLNDIVDGVGVANGSIRYWLDGELLISSDNILLRTGEHRDMAFNQFIFAPYIGDGSPIDQTMWVDGVTVAVGQ